MTALTPYVPRAVNRMTDPSAESGASGLWISNNSGLYPATFDTTVKVAGTRSVKTVRSATSPGTNVSSVTASPVAVANALRVPASPGEALSFGAWVRADAIPVNVRIQITWRDAAGAAIGGTVISPALPVTAANAWQWFAFENVVAPALTAMVSVVLALNRATGNTVGGEQVWMDGLMINSGATVEPYFDGDTAGCSWSGTPNQSQSVRAVVTPWAQWDGGVAHPLDVSGLWNGAALQPADLRDVTVV